MRQSRVEEILLPLKEGLPLKPTVKVGDKITDAVELMVRNNLRSIVVVRNNHPVGLVRLEDAFEKLGLQVVSGK